MSMNENIQIASRENTYISEADILYQAGVEIRLLNDLLQQSVYQEIELRIFEPALESFGERCSNGEGNHHIVSILRSAARISKWRRRRDCRRTYMVLNPEPPPGVICLRMELSLSVAILTLCEWEVDVFQERRIWGQRGVLRARELRVSEAASGGDTEVCGRAARRGPCHVDD